MNRSDIITKLNELYPRLEKDLIDNMVRSLFDTMSDGLLKGAKIEVRGFGAFSIKTRSLSFTNQPFAHKTSQTNNKVVCFRAGKALKERVDRVANDKTANPE